MDRLTHNSGHVGRVAGESQNDHGDMSEGGRSLPPSAIPEDVMRAAEQAIYGAWDTHAALFGDLSNSISSGLFDRLIDYSARAIMVERERCARIAEEYYDKALSSGQAWIDPPHIGIRDAIRKGEA